MISLRGSLSRARNPILHDKSTTAPIYLISCQAIPVSSVNGGKEPETLLDVCITVRFDSHINYLGQHAPRLPSEIGFYCLPIAFGVWLVS